MPSPLYRRQFASDNYAGIAPAAWRAIEQANNGHAPAYGEDAWTQKAANLIRETFETDCEVFFVFNGTAANSLALSSLCQSYHSILCHELAHIETDECGAPEFFSNGTKILPLSGAQGKIRSDGIDFAVRRRSDVHYPKPRVVSVTQSTELGTIYQPDELKAIGEVCKRHGLALHMDGARFGYALASLGLKPRQISWECGVDVLCLGGTKLGTAVGDAVLFFRKELAYEFEYRCKQAGQLASKMRFLSAPWVGMLEHGAWLDLARHANARAARLSAGLAAIPGFSLVAPCQANAVFVNMPNEVIATLRDKGWKFYTFIGAGGVRLMCSWDTTDDDVDAFLTDARTASGL